MTDQTLKTTPLNAAHRALGARMVGFGGYDMPVQYEGVLAEHRWTREHAGLFDVSHMGQCKITGEDATAQFERTMSTETMPISRSNAPQLRMRGAVGSILSSASPARMRSERARSLRSVTVSIVSAISTDVLPARRSRDHAW